MASKQKTAGKKTITTAGKSARLQKRTPSMLVCGIGCSAGGLTALEKFFREAPSDSHIAYIVISHQGPDHKSMLAQLLSKFTTIPAAVIKDGQKIEPGHIYISPPGMDVSLVKNTLHTRPAVSIGGMHLPIDTFFQSLAREFGDSSAGIILSGTGSDGTRGLKEIRINGGLLMVQDPNTTDFSGMPRSAIQSMEVDYIQPPGELARTLAEYARKDKPSLLSRAENTLTDEAIGVILDLLRTRSGRDFTEYKFNSVGRRIERRMHLHDMSSAEDYIQYLRQNPHEIDLLYKELLIGVTRFFRDEEAWEVLREKGLPHLLARIRDTGRIRAWVVGCTTGEEAYTLAFVLQEFFEENNLSPEIQIFATDLDERSIIFARTGKYSQGIAVDMKPDHLKRYFSLNEESFSVSKDIRKKLIFATHDVTQDPPFMNIDLITCRNLLIYMNTSLQQRVLPMFHYILNQDGLLLLGPSETLGGCAELFVTLDRKWRLYERRSVPSASWLQGSFGHSAQWAATGTDADVRNKAVIPVRTRDNSITRLAEHLFVKMFTPPSVIINEKGDIFYLQGQTSPFLELPVGQPRMNLFDMAREELRLELITVVRKAATKKSSTPPLQTIEFTANGHVQKATIKVFHLDEPEALQGLFVVTFLTGETAAGALVEEKPQKSGRKAGQSASKTPATKTRDEEQRIVEMKLELQHLRETLRTTVEELETSNEQLRASNEELESTNEELQSTNEELETSKEEMQSLNEELTTVNSELQAKVDELGQLSDDMINLLNSTGVATLFLDNNMRINRFNEQSKSLFRLISSDVGRLLGDITSNLEYTELIQDAEKVARTLEPLEKNIRGKDGSWQQMRLTPYRTSSNEIRGVVITFVDISTIKKTSDINSLAERVIRTLSIPLLILDRNLRVLVASQSFYTTFALKPQLVEGELIYQIGGGEWDIAELRRLLTEVVEKQTDFESYKVSHNFPRIGFRVMQLEAQTLAGEQDQSDLILLLIRDISELQHE